MSGGDIERAPIGAGMTATSGVAGSSLAKSGETAALAVAEAAKANVLARFQIARMCPRDASDARVKILRECDRPRFAEVAVYELPRGEKTITGPSIRLAEVCARAWGNITIESPVTFEDEEKRILSVSVTDLETNTTYGPTGVVVEKTVERRNPPRNQGDVVGTRANAQGQMLYIVRASDADVLGKQNAIVSKTIRNLILRLVPGDIVEEAVERANEVHSKKIKDDPTSERKRVIDAFAEINVLPSQLGEALGHPVDQCSPAEIKTLRGWYAAIRDGDLTIRDVIAERKKPADPPPETPADATASASSTASSKISRAARNVAAASAKPVEATLADVIRDPKPQKSPEERAAAIARGEDPEA